MNIQVDADFYLPVIMDNYFVKNGSNLGRAAAIFRYVFREIHSFLSLMVQLVLRPAKKTLQTRV